MSSVFVLSFILFLLLVAIGYVVVIYNGLVTLKHAVSKAWANIDVLLKQRHDELPKLVEVCRQYMGYESETLEKIVAARGSVMKARDANNIGALGIAESQLRMGLTGLFAVAEDYPTLKANEQFLHLQKRISELENAISDRREVYNESVNNNNVRIEQFPDSIIASRFNFGAFELLRFTDGEKADVSVKSLFGG